MLGLILLCSLLVIAHIVLAYVISKNNKDIRELIHSDYYKAHCPYLSRILLILFYTTKDYIIRIRNNLRWY